jgi:hypothetical protein
MRNLQVFSVLLCMGSLISIAQSRVPSSNSGPATQACSLLDGPTDQREARDDSALLAAYNVHAHLIRSLHMEAMMQVKAGKEYGLGEQLIEVPVIIDSAAPNLMRLMIVLPMLGGNGFEMASDGREFSLLLPVQGRKVLVIGPLDEPAESQNPLQNLRPQPLLDALNWPEAKLIPGATPQTSADSSIRKLSVTLAQTTDGPRTAQIEFDFGRGLVNSVATYDSAGQILSTVRYSDWQAAESTQGHPSVSCLPRHIELVQPTHDYEIALRVIRIALDPEIPRSYFHPSVPGGTPVIRLDQPGKVNSR